MAKKPLTYQFHPSMFYTTETNLRRMIGGNLKGVSRREMIQDISRSEPYFHTSLNFIVFSEDLAYERSAREVVLPEGPEIYHELLQAKYTMNSAKGFSLPFSSFVLCMPKGFEMEGVEIPACLVTYGDYRSSPEKIIYPFSDYINAPRPQVGLSESSENSNYLSITYLEPGTISYARVMAVDDDLPKILSAETPEACRDAIGDYGFFDRLTSMNEKDMIIQFYLMKLVSSIGIYLIANQQQGLKSGFPGKLPPKFLDRDPSFSIRMNTLLNKPPIETFAEKPQAARWHFSQDQRDDYNGSSMDNIRLDWLRD